MGFEQAGKHPQFRKVWLRGKPLDRLDQVLVRVRVAGDDLAHDRDKLERILPVHPASRFSVNSEAGGKARKFGLTLGIADL